MISGCATGGSIGIPGIGAPKVSNPVQILPVSFRDSPPASMGDSARWWEQFADPTLNQLVRDALNENITVQVAYQRLKEARATGRATIAGFAPRINFVASASTDYARDNQKLITSSGELVDQQTTGSQSFRASWEVPLFGRLSSAISGARANEAGAAASLEGAKVAVIADLAAAYNELRNAQQSLAFLREEADRAQQLNAIANEREANGLISLADKGLIQGQAAQIKQKLPDAELRVKAGLDRIAILRGVVPGSLDTLLIAIPDYKFNTQAPLVVEVPADFIRRRLDVKRAEQDAILQAASVGIARADLYPSLSIVGTITTLSSLAGSPLAASRELANTTPVIDIPLFNFGQRRASVRTSQARFKQALLAYRSTTLNAIAEAQTALSAYQQARLRVVASLEGETAAQVRYLAALSGFKAGLIAYKERLDAESALAAAKQTRLASQAQLSDAAIGLYRTFAGSPGI
ncbi:RND transporter [Candidatus Phycosocius spiralis]|uniref:RND transporter n=2 Tax=Candidatus Phycosocius spiralis TaxID=2815099 RepID=A0ABQ4PX30_9PROT|nr:RND transporter [Candidatus Phycosocius spiralis]